MLKFLVTALVLYFFYKMIFPPRIAPKDHSAEESVRIRKKNKHSTNDKDTPGEYIDYEEVD